jgi:Zn finger protein HypA/HybF involved in hydrogenase expression
MRPIVLSESPSDPDERALVQCPDCGGIGSVDEDQHEGRVSIDCPKCEYHETHDLRDP